MSAMRAPYGGEGRASSLKRKPELLLSHAGTARHRGTLTPVSSSCENAKAQPCDVLIVGAGILGCAAAVALARQGRSVVLLERNLKEPDRVVGELLQPGGVVALEKLELAESLEGIDAVPVKGYKVFYRGEGVTFWYPPVGVQDCADHESGVSGRPNERGSCLEVVASPRRAKRRPEGRSFHHGKFVMKLREMARREENVTVVQATARELLKHEKSGQVMGVECLTGEKENQRVCIFNYRYLICMYHEAATPLSISPTLPSSPTARLPTSAPNT
jgi:2-polyprenyl-6-methoxyphenol hydroxylase-like FAD-dependent oxidoreductase